jgi:hypothetical protein
MIVKKADIEDYPAVFEIWRLLRDSKDHAFKIEGGDAEFKILFKANLSSPLVQVWAVYAPGAVSGGQCLAFAITQVVVTPVPDSNGIVHNSAQLFIRAVYARHGSHVEAIKALQEEFLKFCKANGCHSIFGNCRLDFNVKAAERAYGWKPKYIVMAKEVE